MQLNNLKPTINFLCTTWWGLWIIFFTYTVLSALVIQMILPHVIPSIFWAHGIFVPDSTGFHRIAARKALEMAQQGWTAWELRPQLLYPAGITSMFYYLWKPEPYAMIPFNAVLHATSGCLVYLLLSSFIRNRLAAACGAGLFVLNPASLEWTSQIHRDGTYILGNLMMLTGWYLLIKGLIQKRRVYFLYSLLLTIAGSLGIWVSRPYWNQVAIVACFLLFAVIVIYVLIHAKDYHPSWLLTTIVTGCLMIGIQVPFMFLGAEWNAQSQAAVEKEKQQITKQEKLFETNQIKEKWWIIKQEKLFNVNQIKEILHHIAAFHVYLEGKHQDLFQYKSGENINAIRADVEKKKVNQVNFEQLSKEEKKEYLHDLMIWHEGLMEWYKALNEKRSNVLNWQQTPYLPSFIDNKLYGLWVYRLGTAGAAGNTSIDRYTSLNSFVAFVKYLPRAMQIGFLSPFPSEWFRQGSTPASTLGKRMIGGMMILFYTCLLFFIWCLCENRSNLLFWIITLYSTFGLIVFTYVYANVGTLSRLRYGFYMVIVCSGFAFAIEKIMKRGKTIP